MVFAQEKGILIKEYLPNQGWGLAHQSTIYNGPSVLQNYCGVSEVRRQIDAQVSVGGAE